MIRQSERPDFNDIRNVEITDSFFKPFYEKIRKITIPDVFRKFISEGAVENYERVARGETGGHVGPPWYHGLICEVIRGVSDLLAVQYDEMIDRQLDEIIASIRRAIDADPEGWLHPYDTLMKPHGRFGLNGASAVYQHETYDAGALFEAGVHHYRATGKTSLLEIAVRNANYFVDHVGDAPKWKIVCEHSLAEMTLVMLEELFEEEPELAEKVGARRGEYLKLAKFFVDHKGDNEGRIQFPKFLQEYAQDHRPAREQREAVGHAVRAVLFYTAMADIAMKTNDEGLETAANAIWKDITETKLHINGCVGAHRDMERFGSQYSLPNDAYLETCAGVALMFFGSSMFRMTGKADIWDVVENTVNNLLPAAVSADGTHYTYENPLESRGGRERWSWHGCPCCPPMLLKAVGILPSYIFAQKDDNLWLNLYIDSKVRLDGAGAELISDDSGAKIIFDCEKELTANIRVPSWAEDFKLLCNGVVSCSRNEGGYISVKLNKGRNEINVSFVKCPVKIIAHPYVGADSGRVAINYGPVLYCCEKQVEKWEDLDPLISKEEPVFNEDRTITLRTSKGDDLVLIPYRDWNNHGALPMRTWFRQEGYVTDPMNTEGWEGKLYRKLTF